MGMSYGKLTTAHEEAIYTLKKASESGRAIREKLLAGYDGLDPVEISPSRANQVARKILDERDELYSSDVKNKPAPEGLRILTRRLMIIAERETIRLERAEKGGRLDATKLGKLAGAVTKLHTLLERNDALGNAEPDNKGDAPEKPPSSFADSLIAQPGAQPVPDVPTPPPGSAAPPIGDHVVPTTPVHAVPTPPSHPTVTG